MKQLIITVLCLSLMHSLANAGQQENIAVIQKAIEVLQYQMDTTATEIMKIQSAESIDFPRLETFLEQESLLRHEIRRFEAKLLRLRQGIDHDTKMEPEDPRSSPSAEFVNQSPVYLILAVHEQAEETLLARFLLPPGGNLFIQLSPNQWVDVQESVPQGFQTLYSIQGPFQKQVIVFDREKFKREDRAQTEGIPPPSQASE